MKISLITTVKNEGNSIKAFLESILWQTRLPNEFIIVDGGSTDETVTILYEYSPLFEQRNIVYKIIVKNNANIAEGRNIAISNSSGDIIACTDAGCVLSENWLEEIIKPFDQDPTTDVVSGWYEPLATSKFEEIVAEITYPKLEKVLHNPNKFLPSSRSVAFKKKCWEQVGGYPEWLHTAEDTLYDLRLKKVGCKFVFTPDAVVYWKVRESLLKLFKQYYNYAKGNGKAGLFFKQYFIQYYLPMYIAVALFWYWISGDIQGMHFILLYICGILGYLFLKARYKHNNLIKVVKYLPLSIMVELTVLLAEFLGYSLGIVDRVRLKLKNLFVSFK
ncbi:MAG: hypothetical protein PWP22_1246 [Thermoanaerobacter sp.]|nr:hypothetical protein [Thermoanaerobacter sp.]